MGLRLTGFLAATCIFTWIPSVSAWADDPSVRRTTLFVSDVEKSRAFYEIIGFRTWLDWTGDQDPNDPTALPLNEQAEESRIVIMAGADDYNGMIGLLAFDAPPLSANRIDPNALGINDIILMIETKDICPIHTKLVAAGYEILRNPKPYRSDGPSGKKQGQNMLVRDPDGYVIELTDVREKN